MQFSAILESKPSNSSGEPTQGGASVSFIISKNPRTLSLEENSSFYTTEVMDFWRPIYKSEALFDGKLSAYTYLKSLDITFHDYLEKSKLKKSEIDYFCFHCPFGKMVRKAARQIGDVDIEDTILYNTIIGNSCSASLYMCFVSLLDNSKKDLSNKRIGFFSYGSGSVAEFFSGKISEGYKNYLFSDENKKSLDSRSEISFEEYEMFRKNEFDRNDVYENCGSVRFSGIVDDKRIYERV